MDRAKFLNDNGNYEYIYADKITYKEYELKYKGKLFCEEQNCNAEMIFYDRQIRGRMKIFKTKSRSIHKQGCKHEIKRGIKKESTILLLGKNVNVGDKHIKRVLKDSYIEYYKKVHKIKDDSTKRNVSNNKKSNLSGKTDKSTTKVYKYKNSASTNGEGNQVIGQKEPPIYKREVSDIRDKDENLYREVHGILRKFIIKDDEVVIILKGLGGTEIDIYIGIPFKIASSQEFKLIKNCERYFERKNNEQAICNCIGQITTKEKRKIVQVFSATDITFDGMTIINIANSIVN